MVLEPGFSGVVGVSSVVSDRDDGVADWAARICTEVPVLVTFKVTAPIVVGCGSCSIRPTPFLNPGNGDGSEYVSVDHAVLLLPSMACPAVAGESASPSGENTVARTGFTVLPVAADELPWVCSLFSDGAFRPSSSRLRPPPTSPKMLLRT